MKVIPLDAPYIDDFYLLFKEIMTTEFSEFEENEIYIFVNLLHKKENLVNPQYLKMYDHIIAVDDDDKVIGFLIGNKSVTGVVNIPWMGVKKDARKMGVGSELLCFFEKMSDREGYHLMELNTIRGKEEFYIKNGFEEIGVRKDGHYHIDNLIMNKRIR